jgi:hypothetical protein
VGLIQHEKGLALSLADLIQHEKGLALKESHLGMLKLLKVCRKLIMPSANLF